MPGFNAPGTLLLIASFFCFPTIASVTADALAKLLTDNLEMTVK